MDNSHGQKAGASCTVRYDANCTYCKLKVLEIMRSVRGNNYDVIIDAERGLVSMNAEVDPNIFVSAINSNYERHGELVRARITRVDNKSNEVNYGCTHNNVNHHYSNHHALPSTVCHALPAAGGIPGGDGVVIYPNGFESYRRHDGAVVYPNGYESYRRHDGAVVYPSGYENHPPGCSNSCCRPMPEAAWVPSYPPQHYGNYYPDQYGSGINCNIM